MFELNLCLNRLGRNLKKERKKKKLSQEELSFISSIDKNYISKIECGKANISVSTLNKISKALKVRL